MTVKFKPMNDRVLVRIEPVENKTESGIIVATANQRTTDEPKGHVLAIGSKVTDVKVGDKVIIARHGCETIKVDGESLITTTESDILCILG